MRIRISGIDTPIAGEKRAYAEYRFFTSIAPYDEAACRCPPSLLALKGV